MKFLVWPSAGSIRVIQAVDEAEALSKAWGYYQPQEEDKLSLLPPTGSIRRFRAQDGVWKLHSE